MSDIKSETKHEVPSNKLSEQQLAELQNHTLDDYSGKAEDFWARTRDHDVSQNYVALLSQFPAEAKLDLLDFGCGPGRDLAYFSSKGHRPVGLDGSLEFCQMARNHSGCEVLHQQFLALDLGPGRFDGVFANASLFHVPKQRLTAVLQQLHVSLSPGGILFASNPRGQEEGWRGRRFGNFMEFDVLNEHLVAAGFEVLDHYYRPEGQPRNQQPWIAVVSRKP